MPNWTDGYMPIAIPIPYDFGRTYYYGWASYITVTMIGVLLNAMALIFMFIDRKESKNQFTVYLTYLAGQDLAASITCLIQCAINLHHGGLLGENTACIIEAFQVVFFVGISGFSVCLYGFYLRERTMTSKTKYVMGLSSKKLLVLHLVAWSIYAVLAFMATYWPGESRLLSSGTYCMPALEQPYAAAFFFGLIIAPCAIFLVVNYLTIYANYVRIKKDVAEDFGKERKTNTKLVTQFLCFVAVYGFFYLPFLMAACYEWITGNHASAYFDLVAGIMTHLVSVMNPIMYVLTTKRFRRLFVRLANNVPLFSDEKVSS